MRVQPIDASTIVDARTSEWIPESFDGFLRELNHITNSCRKTDSLPLFRGQRKREWRLDSTFVRFARELLFGLPPQAPLSKRILECAEFHSVLVNLYLLKFGVLVRPSQELEIKAAEHGLDSWFELMKRYQQYPQEDSHFIKGTNVLDWTQSADVALYFANLDREGEGAIFVCDATATGKTLQVLPVGAILDKMSECAKSGKPLGGPLLFCPSKQIKNQRAKNQQAVYFAQMDLRYDLEEIWRSGRDEFHGEAIIVKLVLPKGTEQQTSDYLERIGVTHSIIFPDEQVGDDKLKPASP